MPGKGSCSIRLHAARPWQAAPRSPVSVDTQLVRDYAEDSNRGQQQCGIISCGCRSSVETRGPISVDAKSLVPYRQVRNHPGVQRVLEQAISGRESLFVLLRF